MGTEDSEAFGIGRFDDENSAGREPGGAQPDHLGKTLGRQMLDYLRAENTVENAFRLLGKIGEEVCVGGVEAGAATVVHGLRARLDAPCRHSQFPHQFEKLAAAATEVEDTTPV